MFDQGGTAPAPWSNVDTAPRCDGQFRWGLVCRVQICKIKTMDTPEHEMTEYDYQALAAHERATEILLEWATDDGSWYDAEVYGYFTDRDDTLEDIAASHGRTAAELVDAYWEEAVAEVKDAVRNELERRRKAG